MPQLPITPSQTPSAGGAFSQAFTSQFAASSSAQIQQLQLKQQLEETRLRSEKADREIKRYNQAQYWKEITIANDIAKSNPELGHRMMGETFTRHNQPEQAKLAYARKVKFDEDIGKAMDATKEGFDEGEMSIGDLPSIAKRFQLDEDGTKQITAFLKDLVAEKKAGGVEAQAREARAGTELEIFGDPTLTPEEKISKARPSVFRKDEQVTPREKVSIIPDVTAMQKSLATARAKGKFGRNTDLLRALKQIHENAKLGDDVVVATVLSTLKTKPPDDVSLTADLDRVIETYVNAAETREEEARRVDVMKALLRRFGR